MDLDRPPRRRRDECGPSLIRRHDTIADSPFRREQIGEEVPAVLVAIPGMAFVSMRSVLGVTNGKA